MQRPFVGDYRLTQGFGLNPADYARFGLKGHNGLDYGLPAWTPVLAPHSGKVVEASFDAGGYGNYVKVESANEGSVLAHLAKISVPLNEAVAEGELIGYSGNTGNSTGPHLHWGYYRIPRDRSNGYAGFIDQTPYINPAPIAQPTTQPTPMNDQTIIPRVLLGTDQDLEIQQIRGLIGDLRRLQNTPPPAPNPADLSISQLFNAIRIKLGL